MPDAIRVELVTDKRRRFGLAARVYRNGEHTKTFGVVPLNLTEYRAGREEARLDMESIRLHGARVLGGPAERKGEPELIDLRKES